MRPRVFPAEDLEEILVAITEVVGFNEAAGIPRGRPPRPKYPGVDWIELQ